MGFLIPRNPVDNPVGPCGFPTRFYRVFVCLFVGRKNIVVQKFKKKQNEKKRMVNQERTEMKSRWKLRRNQSKWSALGSFFFFPFFSLFLFPSLLHFRFISKHVEFFFLFFLGEKKTEWVRGGG